MATINDGLRTIGQLLLHHPTKDAYARDRNGYAVPRGSPEAYCFCFIGACWRVGAALALPLDILVEEAVAVSGCNYENGWDRAARSLQQHYAQVLAGIKDP